jgi:hypothetical protein
MAVLDDGLDRSTLPRERCSIPPLTVVSLSSGPPRPSFAVHVARAKAGDHGHGKVESVGPFAVDARAEARVDVRGQCQMHAAVDGAELEAVAVRELAQLGIDAAVDRAGFGDPGGRGPAPSVGMGRPHVALGPVSSISPLRYAPTDAPGMPCSVKLTETSLLRVEELWPSQSLSVPSGRG